MNKTQKWFALAATFIFLSLTCLPAVQSENISEEPEEIQEVTFEIHTLNGVKEITKLLSTEQIERLSVLTEELQSNIQTLQEPTATLAAQSEADNKICTILAELHDYGLLGDFSINAVKDLVTGKYLEQMKDSVEAKRLEKIIKTLDLDIRFGGFNVCCYTEMSGNILNFHPYNFIPMFLYLWSFNNNKDLYWTIFPFIDLIKLIEFIPHPTTVGLWIIERGQAGFYQPKVTGHISSLGLLGRQGSTAHDNSPIIVFTLGFTGVIIRYFGEAAMGFSLCTGWVTK